jgi:hypothetical protein
VEEEQEQEEEEEEEEEEGEELEVSTEGVGKEGEEETCCAVMVLSSVVDLSHSWSPSSLPPHSGPSPS